MLLKSYLQVVEYLSGHGELLKAYVFLKFAPSYLENDKKVIKLKKAVVKQISKQRNVNNYGFWEKNKDGMAVNFGFVDPDDVYNLPRVKRLIKDLKKYDLWEIADVGCFSGWLGRRLSVEGIGVYGIDVHPSVIELAKTVAAGSLAEFGCMPAQKLGIVFPKRFDGVVLFDVIEHVFDPENLILSVEKALKKGGWVFLTIPDLKVEHKIKPVPLDENEHMRVFSKERIDELFGKKKNYSIESMLNEDNCYNWYVKYQGR